MGKSRKTKAQKIIADLRRQLQQVNQAQNVNVVVPTLPKIHHYTSRVSVHSTKTINTGEIKELSSDLLKTAIVSISIVAFEMVLFFLFKIHLLVLPKIYF